MSPGKPLAAADPPPLNHRRALCSAAEPDGRRHPTDNPSICGLMSSRLSSAGEP
jgi:hypothetical protein